MSQPPGVAAGLSVYPRIAGAASGLLGFTQMTIAALGTLLLGLLPRDNVVAMVAVVGASTGPRKVRSPKRKASAKEAPSRATARFSNYKT